MKGKEYYKNLKEALPYGAQSDAAKKFRITESAVSQIASGKIENYDVLQYLLQRAITYQKSLNKIRKEMEKIGKERSITL